MQKLTNQSLLKHCSFINGRWMDSEQTFEVFNPASGEVICQICETNASQAEQAINAADKALTVWQALQASDRAARLNHWQALMRENLDDLAYILTLEQGKPLKEAKGEILHAANYVKLYAELASELTKPRPVDCTGNQSASVFRRPIGVVAAITPWNFPCSMVLRKAAAALAAGCSVVLKPSELTPLSALALAKLSVDAGIPEGVFNVLVGSNAQAIGEILTQHSKVAKLSFTGSTKIGKKLLQQCAAGVKRTSMELGGNAPFIVFDDADIELAVSGAISSRFRNAGQTCVSANRFLIHQGILDEFKVCLIAKTKELHLADGFDPSSQIGPLINFAAIDKMQRLVERALAEGGTLLLGGKQAKLPGYFFEPTILENITPDMDLFQQEIFGPIVSITTFENESQAVELANQSELGLCGYLYTSDQQRIVSIASKLQLGMLGINEARLSNPAAPFGGIKQSGMGREGGHYGIEEYLDYQYVCQTKTSG
jgi:succinate-semialdehyde dehydrogenase/glutarate-semialdehyde dehydrogenase